MEPIQGLAASVMAILLPYVAKGGEEFAKTAGEVAFNKAKNLMETLKARLSGDKEAADDLTHFEEKPERYKGVLEDVLKDKLEHDKDLAGEVQKLVRDMGPELEIFQKIKKGEKVVALDVEEFTDGSAKVTQEMEEAEDATAVKVKHLGKTAPPSRPA